MREVCNTGVMGAVCKEKRGEWTSPRSKPASECWMVVFTDGSRGGARNGDRRGLYPTRDGTSNTFCSIALSAVAYGMEIGSTGAADADEMLANREAVTTHNAIMSFLILCFPSLGPVRPWALLVYPHAEG